MSLAGEFAHRTAVRVRARGSAGEMLRRTLDHVARRNGQLNCFTTVLAARAAGAFDMAMHVTLPEARRGTRPA